MMALSKYALQHMKRGDNIVNSASVLAYKGDPSKVDYASTKGAIVTFTRALAQQQAPNGIRVNAVAPGIMYVLLFGCAEKADVSPFPAPVQQQY